MAVHQERAALVAELVRLTQRWARGASYGEERLAAVRGALLDDTAAHVAARVPVVRRLVQQLGGDSRDRPLLGADVFKAYDPAWIDRGDWREMTDWLGQLVDDAAVLAPAAKHRGDLDGWLAALRDAGVPVVCSSGSSGMVSFVPRAAAEWRATRQVGTAALLPLLARRIGRPAERVAARAATTLLPPQRLAAVTGRLRPRGAAAFLLDFADGPTGNQAIARELTGSFRDAQHLYPVPLSAVALRALSRGPRTDEERAALAALQEALVDGGGVHLRRLVDGLRDAAAKGRRAFVFGTPYLLLQVVRTIEDSGRPLRCAPGSVILFGGGWKSFTGEAIARDDLLARVTAALGVDTSRVLEAYSMTELNTMLLRCEHGRFHVPPLVEVCVVDAGLRESRVGDGRLAFRDPLATTRPGFLVTGDAVRLVDGRCDCGLTGPAVTRVERAVREEVKGCAGFAASLPV